MRKVLIGAINASVWALLLGFIFSSVASSDDLQPFFINVSQTEENRFALFLRSSPSVQGPQTAVLQPPCQLQGRGSTIEDGQWRLGAIYSCPENLRKIELSRDALEISPTALIRLEYLSGDLQIFHLPPGQQTLVIDRLDQRDSVFVEYLQFGFQHILEGYDHLLFVLCLLLLAGSLSRVLIMITGFTLAHSLTLGLSVLQLVEVPLPVVEVLIALSIVLLATELVKMDRRTWSFRYPVLVSSAFGLLHGLGFAAAMKSIGLPQNELLWALLAFNIGVETGQILFVLAVLMLFALLTRLRWVSVDQPIRGQAWVSYGIGGISSYWLMDRLWAWLSGPIGLT